MVADFPRHLENDVIFVIEDGDQGEVIGYAVIVIKDGDYWLENIAVLPAEGKKGVGTKLIEHVERYIAGKADKYQLYTNVKMPQNIDWYRRLGFDETKRGTEDGFERVYFVKAL
jgi:ribosomal protein S18 acetylase RimI-like enzyme